MWGEDEVSQRCDCRLGSAAEPPPPQASSRSVLTDQMLPLAKGPHSKPEQRQGPTFRPLHGEQHFADMLRVVTGALDSSVQRLPTVLRVAVRPEQRTNGCH